MKTRIPLHTIVHAFVASILLGPATLPAADVNEYAVLKGREYTQSDAATPSDDWALYWLAASVRMTATDAVTEATVQAPGGDAISLFPQNDSKLLRFAAPVGLTLADFNQAYPNGGYVLAITTAHDGARNETLGVAGDFYPNTPTLQNYASLEAVNPSTPFTLSWAPFTGGTANDFIQVRVIDGSDNEVFRTPGFSSAGGLSGNATSVVIPANTLSPSNSFRVLLTFIKVVARNTVSYPGAVGLSGYYKTTDSGLTTTGGGGGGGDDTTSPQLASSVPANGATGVTVNSPIVFTFNEPMAQAQSIAWSGNVNAGFFTYSWSGDQRTLTCTYFGSLPAGTTIAWTLNPSGFQQEFEDAAGNPLPANIYTGSFTTGGSTNNPCYEGDDGRGTGGVTKELFYVQTGDGPSAPDADGPAMFFASAVSPTNNLITAARMQVPGGPLLTLTNFAGLNRSFADMEHYDSQPALDMARPNGTYTLQLTQTNGATPSAGIGLIGNYPPTPHIENYTDAQAIDPAANFTLRWNGFAGATANDVVSVAITHPASGWYWIAPDLCVPRVLANTATSVVLPAGTLQPGTTYEASLTYSRMTYSSTNAIADVYLLAFLRKQVSFPVKTIGGGASGDARFISWKVLPNGNVELSLQGTAGKAYLIQTSLDLVDWNDATSYLAPPGGVITHQVLPSELGDHAFFRGKAL